MFSTNPLLTATAILGLLPSLGSSLVLSNYSSLITSAAKPGILDVTFHIKNTTINLWNSHVLADLKDLVSKLKDDTETKVVVFRSDVPKYFIAHADLNFDINNPTFAVDSVNLFNDLTLLPQATIGVVSGIARGGGNEFLVSLDMRFASKPHTKLGQIEVGLGIIPGLGGVQYLSRLIGRGRAMEYVLSGNDINAGDAERIGWINKAFDTDAEMEGYVSSLTSRLALFDQEAIQAGRHAVNVATQPKVEDALADEEVFIRLLKKPTVQARTSIGQPVDGDGERYLGENLPLLYGAGVPPTQRRRGY